MYLYWNNLVFASEMYRMALERILKCNFIFYILFLFTQLCSLFLVSEWKELWSMYVETWDSFDHDTQTDALKYIVARYFFYNYFNPQTN